MPIIPTNGQLILPAIPAQTYDMYWMKKMSISAPSPADKAEVLATLTPMNSQTGEVASSDNDVQLILDDVLTLAESDSVLANTVNVIFTEIQRQCSMKGLI